MRSKLQYSTAIIIAFLMVSAGCTIDPPAGIRSAPNLPLEAFIINNLADSISVYHPDAGDGTGRIYNNEIITGSMPNDLFYYNGKLFVVCSGDNSIEVYRESSFEKLGEIYLGPGNNPYAIIGDPDGSSPVAFVSNLLSDSVSVINLDTHTLIDTISDSSLDAPQGGTIMNGYLFICNTAHSGGSSFGAGSVSIFDATTFEFINEVLTGDGSNPQSCLSFPAKDELHVFLSGSHTVDDGKVLILDTTPLASDNPPTEISTLMIGGSPKASSGSYNSSDGSVLLTGTYGLYLYNANTNALPDPESINPILPTSDPSGDLFSGIAFNSNNGTVLLTDFGGDALRIIDAVTYEVKHVIQTSDGPLSVHIVSE